MGRTCGRRSPARWSRSWRRRDLGRKVEPRKARRSRRNRMGDLKSARLIYLKGVLFLLGGLLASGVILVEEPKLKIAVLLAVAVWCFARFYYFAFYVIE